LYSGQHLKQTWHRKIQNDRRLGTVVIFTYYKNNLGRILNNITSSSEIDANYGKNDRSRYSTNIDSLGILKTYASPAPIDQIKPVRISRKYHGEEKFYYSSVLRRSTPTPMPTPTLTVATARTTTIMTRRHRPNVPENGSNSRLRSGGCARARARSARPSPPAP
jgi:hypothetical protein